MRLGATEKALNEKYEMTNDKLMTNGKCLSLCHLPTAHCPLPTAHCPLPTAHCPLPTAHCPLPPASSSFRLPPAFC
jgi:hypothetical protein